MALSDCYLGVYSLTLFNRKEVSHVTSTGSMEREVKITKGNSASTRDTLKTLRKPEAFERKLPYGFSNDNPASDHYLRLD